MKRVYLILTLFMASFFLLSSNVSAATMYTVSESDVEYILSEDFIKLRKAAIKYCDENNLNYIITNNYSVKIFDNSLYNIYLEWDNGYYLLKPSISYKTFQLLDGVFTETGNGNGTTTIVSYYGFSYSRFYDTNIENVIFTSHSSSAFGIKYNDKELVISTNDKFPSLYEFIAPESEVPEPEVPEIPEEVKNKISNFYILIIDKIKVLTDYIATDFTMLFALVIFILVAVIGLVRRL